MTGVQTCALPISATVTMTTAAVSSSLVTASPFTAVAPGLKIDTCADYKAVLKSSTGGVLPDGIAVVFTIKNGYTTATSLTVYTGGAAGGASATSSSATLTVS